VSIDPQFFSSPSDNYNLLLGSHCIDRGDPGAGTDPDGSRLDMGALPTYKTPPQVAFTRPLASQQDVPREMVVTATFDMPMDPNTITIQTFQVSGQGGSRGGSVTYDAVSKTASFAPDEPFLNGETISVQLADAVSSLWDQSLEAEYSWSFEITATTDVVVGDAGGLPERFALHQNYPNPFNAETRIRFSTTEPGPVTLRIYNTLGQLVRSLLETDLPAGNHQTAWSGSDHSGRPLASGVYFYRLETGGSSEVKRMVLLR
jgi:hypothetical protein